MSEKGKCIPKEGEGVIEWRIWAVGVCFEFSSDPREQSNCVRCCVILGLRNSLFLLSYFSQCGQELDHEKEEEGGRGCTSSVCV